MKRKMTGWKYQPSQVVELAEISQPIVRTFSQRLDKSFFSERKMGTRTKHIKCVLAHLGDEQDFKVYANKLSDCPPPKDGGAWKSREWLYDLHWYTEKSAYQPTSLPLVVECEWSLKRRDLEKKESKKDPFSAIKFDFQKLLVANAKLRLMIFKITRGKKTKANLVSDRCKCFDRPVDGIMEVIEPRLAVLDKYFDEAIESYPHLKKGAKFLFIAVDDKAKRFYYTEKSKG